MKPLSRPLAGIVALAAAACGGASQGPLDVTSSDRGVGVDASDAFDADDVSTLDVPAVDVGQPDLGPPDRGPPDTGCTWSQGPPGGAALCYANACPGVVHTLQENRDRLLDDLARRKCTDRCTLWAALNLAERYIFLMDTAYFGASSSQLYPPSMHNAETALDHATALYSINGPMAGQGVDFSGRGGNDYNRIYLGFDGFATCVIRNFAIANPTHDASGNTWQTSDDLAGPHAPFNQREMIFWYRAFYDLNSEGPQFHHWHQDSDFTQSGIDARLGVCGVTDPSLVESTIAFDGYHNSDPLGDYSGRGGYGWQIVSMHVGLDPNWGYIPTACPSTAPVNNDTYGGGTFSGMGPQLQGGVCTHPTLGTCAGGV